GPHGLVAGTTGAGKSELLQTLICALAVVNRPDEMTFVLIDYKGGAAFKECVRLPHTVGMVSDLDRHLTQRALECLAAEIRPRARATESGDYQDPRAKSAGAARRAGTASAPPRYPAGGPPAAGPPPGDRPEHAASVPAQAGAAAGRGMPAGRAAAGSPSAASPSASPLAAGAVSAGAAPVVPAADARARAANGTLGHGAAGLGVTGTVADGPGAAAAAAHVATAAPGGPGLLAGGSGTRPATAEPAAGVGAAALEPLPRLVLIIDEFAALVAELPDFVEGLVDIARRGRSLGIHLILATQRPQGVVTADIQANTSLRIALRVTDTTESSDVIDGPEAAHIPKSLPGRCYVKSGAGAPVAVQAARVGGRAPGRQDRRKARVVDLSWQALGHPVRLGGPVREDVEETDLSLLVDA